MFHAPFPIKLHLSDNLKNLYNKKDIRLALSIGLIDFLFLLFCWQIVGVQADESLNIYGALSIIDGEKIYRDFWVFYTPGIFFLTASIIWAAGKSLLALRIALALASSITAIFLYLIGRKFMGRWAAAASAFLFILTGVNLWPVAVQHWYSTFFLIFCVFWLVRYLERPNRLGSLSLSGTMAGFTFLFQQQKGGMLIVAAGLFLVPAFAAGEDSASKPKHICRAALAFGSGIAAPIVAATIYFWLTGTLGDAVSATIVFPLSHFSGGEGGGIIELYGSSTKSLLERLTQFLAPRWLAGGASSATAFLINIAAPISVPLAMVWWVVNRFRGWKASLCALCVFVTALICFASSFQRPDFYHLISNSPLCYLAVGYLLDSVAGSDAAKRVSLKRIVAAALAFLILLPPLLVAAGEVLYSGRIGRVSLASDLGFVPFVDGNAAAPNNLGFLIDYIQLTTAPDDTIFVVYASPFIYYLTERKNPTRYPVLAMSPCVTTGNVHLLNLTENSYFRAQTEDAIEAIEAAATPVIVLDPAATCLVEYHSETTQTNELAKYLNAQFHTVGDYGGFIILRRN